MHCQELVHMVTEAVAHTCSVKTVFLECLQKFKGKHLSRVPEPEDCNFVKIETGTGVFLRILRNISERLRCICGESI